MAKSENVYALVDIGDASSMRRDASLALGQTISSHEYEMALRSTL
jgi:hypothetical protein